MRSISASGIDKRKFVQRSGSEPEVDRRCRRDAPTPANWFHRATRLTRPRARASGTSTRATVPLGAHESFSRTDVLRGEPPPEPTSLCAVGSGRDEVLRDLEPCPGRRFEDAFFDQLGGGVLLELGDDWALVCKHPGS